MTGKLLPSFGSNFNWHGYTKEWFQAAADQGEPMVRRCKSTQDSQVDPGFAPGQPRVYRALYFQSLNMEHDEPLSSFASNFNLRRYTMAQLQLGKMYATGRLGVERDYRLAKRYLVLCLGRAVQVDPKLTLD